MKPIKDKIFIGLFLLLLIIPSAIQLNDLLIRKKGVENAAFPSFDFPHLGRFRLQFDNYYKQNFGGRYFLLEKYTHFKYYILHTSPVPESVILGKDGWLFLGNSYGDIIYETIGLFTFSQEDLDTLLSVVKSREQWLSERNIKYYVCIAPNKHSVYHDKLPDYITYRPDRTKLEVAKIYLSAHNFDLLDLKTDYHLYTDSIRLFHKTDTHWNKVGAFFAYQALINKIEFDFPGVKCLTLDDFVVDTVASYKEDLSKILNISILENRLVLIPKFEETSVEVDCELEIPESYLGNADFYEQRFKSNKKLKVLVFRDSFGSAIAKYIAESFGECVFIWYHYFDKELIEKEKPDIVIHEIVERNIDVLINDELNLPQ